MFSDLVIPAPAWLALATAGWYLASRAVCGLIPAPRQARTVFGLALPFATTCLVAIVLKHPEVAIGVTLAGSVAAGTLVLGLIGITHTIRPLTTPPKSWLFLLPTALIALLIGFSGEIRITHALVLIAQGVAIAIGTSSSSNQKQPAAVPPVAARWGVYAVAILAMLTASVLAVYATDLMSHDLQQPGSGLIAAVMLSPALILPMVGVTTRLAGERQAVEAVGLVVKVVLINICLLLPLSAIGWLTPASGVIAFAKPFGHRPAILPTSQPSTAPVELAAEVVRFAYPISVWRIDTILLLIIGVFLLLMAFGRIQLGRVEATALVILYAVYLMLTAIAAR